MKITTVERIVWCHQHDGCHVKAFGARWRLFSTCTSEVGSRVHVAPTSNPDVVGIFAYSRDGAYRLDGFATRILRTVKDGTDGRDGTKPERVPGWLTRTLDEALHNVASWPGWKRRFAEARAAARLERSDSADPALSREG